MKSLLIISLTVVALVHAQGGSGRPGRPGRPGGSGGDRPAGGPAGERGPRPGPCRDGNEDSGKCKCVQLIKPNPREFGKECDLPKPSREGKPELTEENKNCVFEKMLEKREVLTAGVLNVEALQAHFEELVNTNTDVLVGFDTPEAIAEVIASLSAAATECNDSSQVDGVLDLGLLRECLMENCATTLAPPAE